MSRLHKCPSFACTPGGCAWIRRPCGHCAAPAGPRPLTPPSAPRWRPVPHCRPLPPDAQARTHPAQPRSWDAPLHFEPHPPAPTPAGIMAASCNVHGAHQSDESLQGSAEVLSQPSTRQILDPPQTSEAATGPVQFAIGNISKNCD